ncbi:hypothetical protein [Thermus sp.]|uniref:hypothetical protein n=1 Tax=Thermus sp. TaxID=275 RepID=UPI003D14C612
MALEAARLREALKRMVPQPTDYVSFDGARAWTSGMVEVEIRVGEERLAPVALPRKFFLDLLEAAEGEVRLTPEGQRLRLEAGGFQAELLTAEAFPQPLLEKAEDPAFRVGEGFLEVMESAFPLGKKLTSHQGKVLVEAEEGRVRVVATDGYRLHLHTLEAEVFQEGAYLLPAQAEGALRALEGELTFHRAWGGKALVAVAENGRAGFPLAEGGFPSYRNALPSAPPLGEVEVERRALLQALKRALAVAHPENHPVRLRADGEGVRVEAMGEGFLPLSEELLPGRGREEVVVNGRYLVDALEEVRKEEARILLYSGPGVPLVEVGDEGFYGLIAGLRPPKDAAGQG